ncbi:hypothetical protein D3C71_1750890 [compost metagenome]
MDEVAVAVRRGQLHGATGDQGVVDLEEVCHQQRPAPGIEQDVVVAHDEAVRAVGQQDQLEADRRALGQVETGFALFLEQLQDARFDLGHRHLAQVEVLDLRAAVPVDHLQQAPAGVPQE